MNKAYLGLGSNRGDSRRHLQDAVALLQGLKATTVTQVSSFYETEPWGYTNQAAFLNIVVAIDTSLNPEELLHHCLTIEQQLGRTREIHWGPRTIDIDVLIYEHITCNTPALTLPHPRMRKRAFVLVPLQEVAPSLRLQGKALSYWLDKIENHGIVATHPWNPQTL